MNDIHFTPILQRGCGLFLLMAFHMYLDKLWAPIIYKCCVWHNFINTGWFSKQAHINKSNFLLGEMYKCIWVICKHLMKVSWMCMFLFLLFVKFEGCPILQHRTFVYFHNVIQDWLTTVITCLHHENSYIFQCKVVTVNTKTVPFSMRIQWEKSC